MEDWDASGHSCNDYEKRTGVAYVQTPPPLKKGGEGASVHRLELVQ